MDFHRLKANDVEIFCQNQYCIELMLSGIAAINANMELFGGKDSTNAKIKIKRMNQRVKQILSYLNKDNLLKL